MISWLSIDVNDPIMDETIINKKKGTVKLIQLDSRHGIENNIVMLIADGFELWSDTK